MVWVLQGVLSSWDSLEITIHILPHQLTLLHQQCCWARNFWLTVGAELVLMELALEGKAGGGSE